MRIKPNFKIAVLALSIACFGVLACLGVAAAVEPERVISGVSVLGCDLSGLTREMGEDRLERLEKKIIQASPLVLRYGKKTWRLQPEKIGLIMDREKVLDEAFRVGRRGSVLQRFDEWRRARNQGVRIPLYVKMDEARLENEIRSIAGEITAPPRDARLKINPDETVEVVPSRDGMTVDLDKVYRDIQDYFRNYGSVSGIDLSLVRARPQKTTRDVLNMGVNALLASYTTTFDPNDAGRSYNIGVAAGALDGQLIPPGEIFSFNGAVGPRSLEAGYKNAKVIINNEFVDGLGGGVCQVSSTLYNAVLLANLEILERSSHSLPVFYVPAGRDATVSFDQIDFLFKNSTPMYIYLKTLAGPGRLTVKIYGNSSCRREVTIRTRVVETIPFKEIYQQDPALKQGEARVIKKGIPGMKVIAERVVLENGSYRVESLPDSFYRPVDQIVLAGPGPVPAGGSSSPAGAETNPAPVQAGQESGSGGPAPGGPSGTGGASENPGQIPSGSIVPPSPPKKENPP
ncbi:MAG: VanW family protein [Peptococcaceae bacterium]|nr:VanW family protein [Peptococcaceae bacterium]